MPKIFGKFPTFELTKELQRKVTGILDYIIENVKGIEGQRSGKVVKLNNRLKERKVAFRLTGHESDYPSLPWHAAYLEEDKNIREAIRKEFDAPETRRAVIDATAGSLLFDDGGIDASKTLGWMLIRFGNVVFESEQTILKRCLWCKKYFLHNSLRYKKYCRDTCRYNDHNKKERE